MITVRDPCLQTRIDVFYHQFSCFLFLSTLVHRLVYITRVLLTLRRLRRMGTLKKDPAMKLTPARAPPIVSSSALKLESIPNVEADREEKNKDIFTVHKHCTYTSIYNVFFFFFPN